MSVMHVLAGQWILLLLLLLLCGLGDQLLVPDLPLVVWVDVDPLVGDPLGPPRHHAASVQRVLVLLAHPACRPSDH